MPRPLLLSAILSLLAQALHAQTTFATSPPNLLSTEGPGAAIAFGSYQASRVMLFDGELQGSAGLVRDVALRGDDRSYTTLVGMGRSWSSVTLDVSHCDMTKLSATFSQNPTTTPNRVFSGGLAFPTRTGAPLVRPDPFGSLTGAMRLPFSSSWVYLGNQALCLDFDFIGGQLANAGAWTATVRRDYALDGYVQGATSNWSQENRYGGSLQNGGCADAGANYGYGSYASVSATTYSLNSSRYPGQIVLAITSLFTAPSRPVIHAFHVSGSSVGVPFPGVTCNNLYLQLDAQTILETRTAANATSFGIVQYDLAVPFDPKFKGVPVWMQAAFDDSGSGSLRLTNASSNLIPDMPRSIVRKVLYATTSSAATGSGPSDDATWNPVLRFER